MASRRALALRPVHSEKKENTLSSLATDFGSATIQLDILEAVQDPTGIAEIEIGTTVRYIFFELNIAAETITNPKILHWAVVKEPFGTAQPVAPTTVDGIAKRFILKRGMEMLPKDVSTVFKRIFVVRIPPRLRRMGDSDKLVINFRATSTESINVCLITIARVFF